MMKLPTNGKSKQFSDKDQKHIQKVNQIIKSKQSGVVAKSVHSVKSLTPSLGTKINKVLAAATTKNTKQTGGSKAGSKARVADLKKNYGWNWRRSLRILSIAGVVALVLLVIASGVGVAYAIDAYNKAPVINQETLQAKQSSIVYLADGKTELFRFYGNENRKNVALSETPVAMQYAIIGLEEKDFYKQDLPWLSIVRAAQECVLGKVTGNSGRCAGASGLAQQLYRNVKDDNSDTLSRKVRELFAAKKLLDTNTKDEILELYMNWVPFGKTIAGVQVASNQYFGKDVKDVTLPQACLIASMPQNPANFENAIYAREDKNNIYYKYWERLQARKNQCLTNLSEYDLKGDGKKLIKSADELAILQKADLGIVSKTDSRKYPHFQDYVQKELTKIFADQNELNEGGYKVVTTLDPVVQDKLDFIYDSQENKDRLISGSLNNAAGVILDGATGNIIGMRGSMDYNNVDIDGQVNIVDSNQAPGSTMKLYDYAAAMDAGFNPSTVLLDAQTDFGGYKPANFSGSGEGLVTMGYALQNSLNISAVKSAYLAAGAGTGPDGEAGITKVTNLAATGGLKITDECKAFVSTALGACDVNMLSHASGFNTFAQDGNLRTPTPFLSITRQAKSGKTDMEKTANQAEADADNKRIADKLVQVYPKKEAAIKPTVARQMQSILSDRSLISYGSLSKYLTLPGWEGRIAAKTGTATGGNDNAVSDVWTAGFSKKYTVVTWAGNTRNELESNGLTGLLITSPTWQAVMAFLHADLDPTVTSTFSTEGLTKTDVGCPYGVKGGKRCGEELLSAEQITILKNAREAQAKPGYNAFEKTIFENRNEVYTIKKYVSKFDRKVVDKDKFPPEYTELVQCLLAPSAFPKFSNWLIPASGYAGSQDNKCNETSTIDPNAIGIDLTSNPNITNGSNLDKTITFTAKGRVENQGIKGIEFKIDGVTVDTSKNSILMLDPGSLGASGTRNVLVRVTDSFDKTYDFNYTDIQFKAKDPLKVGDINAYCDPNEVNHFTFTTNCVFNLPLDRSWSAYNTIRLSIGNTMGSACDFIVSNNTFKCNGVPIQPIISDGSLLVKAQLKSGQSFENTNSQQITVK